MSWWETTLNILISGSNRSWQSIISNCTLYVAHLLRTRGALWSALCDLPISRDQTSRIAYIPGNSKYFNIPAGECLFNIRYLGEAVGNKKLMGIRTPAIPGKDLMGSRTVWSMDCLKQKTTPRLLEICRWNLYLVFVRSFGRQFSK